MRNAEAQVQLIDDLLDLSRITSGKMRLDARRIDLAPVVHEALDAVRPAAEAKAIRLLADVDARSGPVTADPGRVQQVVWNLLMNAVKFTPAGGEVRVSLHRAGSHVEIVVSDSGQGIAPELLPHVFERFRQADSSSTRAYGGLGLGLALVRHLVELHGGTVGARSAGQDTGATFIVTLPVVAAAAAGEMALPAPRVLDDALARSSSPLDGWRVLVVDDERDALALAQATLETAGASVRACLSVGAALTELKQWRPDVLVSDIEMPGEDGYSLIRKVRALAPSEGGDTPAVALTAYGRVQDRLRALDAGFTVHLTKPVDPSELASVVASVAAQPRRDPHPAGAVSACRFALCLSAFCLVAFALCLLPLLRPLSCRLHAERPRRGCACGREAHGVVARLIAEHRRRRCAGRRLRRVTRQA